MGSPKVLMCFDEDGEAPYIKCVCGNQLGCEHYMIDDYVDHPMIWAYECCGGRFFLDGIDIGPDGRNIYFEHKKEKVVGKAKDIFHHVSKENENLPVYEIGLCKILKVLGSNMFGYICDHPLTTEEIISLGEKGVFTYDKSYLYKGPIDYDAMSDIMTRLKVVKVFHREQKNYHSPEHYNVPHIIDKNYRILSVEKNMNFALPCNSYDFENPEHPYPSFVDTSHDGTPVNCIIIHQGKEKYVYCSGD